MLITNTLDITNNVYVCNYKAMEVMKKEYKITANYKFYPSFIERLRAQAKHERRTMTSIIEYAVNLYIENNSPGSAGVQPGGDDDRP